eukprot:CAMPEP_0183380042 /NCGR_PEP_ID=MMETSP0164_2-20130417/125731_1 /TAXON_ID=221442 /ORGANISM="Coccolithus pelagicus ssp braarudi, Strain PLY182g" /LENGTH=48 /DNA_ID= /DNA_START= /DNA_END= /DNA_ORIENTATION=
MSIERLSGVEEMDVLTCHRCDAAVVGSSTAKRTVLCSRTLWTPITLCP